MARRRFQGPRQARERLSKKKRELSELSQLARRLKERANSLYRKASSIYDMAYETFYNHQTPPGYTDHGALHVHAVLRNTDDLLWGLHKNLRLDDSEYYLLLVSILLHDIGHLEYDIAWDDSEADSTNHAEKSRNIILKEASSLQLDEHEAAIISEICYSHGVKDYRNLMADKWGLEGIGMFNPHLIMAFLRLADLTDLAYTRAPSFVFKVRRKMQHANREHWNKHKIIQKVNINCDEWAIIIYARPRSIKERFELENFRKWLEDELLNTVPDLNTVGLHYSKVRIIPDESLYRKPVNPKPSHNPFPGLPPFRDKQAGLFFGREAFVNKIIRITQEVNFLVLVGHSGAGKTSVIEAGLYPELKSRGHATASYRFNPDVAGTLLNALGNALDMNKVTGLSAIREKLNTISDSHNQLYLHLDQFEEIFSLDIENQDKEAGFALLTNMLKELKQLRIIATMRSEFVIDLLELGPQIGVVFGIENVKRLAPLNNVEAREAIVKPMLRFNNLSWQKGLAKTIIDNLTTDQANVFPPHLQLVCQALINDKFGVIASCTGKESRGPFEISLAQYEKLGRAEGIINRYFQKILDRFSPSEREVIDQILSEMITAAGLKKPIDRNRVIEINNGRIDLDIAMRRLISSRVVRPTLIGYELEHDLLARRLLSLLRGTMKVSSTIRDVIDFMRQNKQKPIFTTNLCEKACLSKAQFNRRFKLETGFSPHRYPEKVRIDEASWLLRETGDTIKEIAARCGFPNPEHFVIVFKRIKSGLTPSDFRQMERSRHATEFN